jgi:hypothetical protein
MARTRVASLVLALLAATALRGQAAPGTARDSSPGLAARPAAVALACTVPESSARAAVTQAKFAARRLAGPVEATVVPARRSRLWRRSDRGPAPPAYHRKRPVAYAEPADPGDAH